jgi:putative Mg2+ transporter-C (MgtC) family protein
MAINYFAEPMVVLQLFTAALLGAIVGLEREHIHKPAGLRTHMLVCIGATLITLVSVNKVFAGGDPSRIASQIVVGIGFIGAGTIFKMENKVEGLTTAASLWTVAGVGLAIGIGLYFEALIATSIVFIILQLGKFEKTV